MYSNWGRGVAGAAQKDPGSGVPIRVNHESDLTVIGITTAGAETNTLTNPQKEGQLLFLHMVADSGDRVVTAATTFNEAGNTIITFANVREAILLISVKGATAGTYRWQEVANAGTALS